MMRIAIIIGLVLLSAGPAASEWRTLEPGLDTQILSAKSSSWGSSTFHVFRVDLNHFKLVALDSRTQLKTPKSSIAALGKARGARLAVNGTYFDEKDRPLGLLLDESGQHNGLRRADWGVFFIEGKRAQLIHTNAWREREKRPVEFAIQVGPRCVVDGELVRLKPQTARRAALGIQPDGRVIIAVTADPTTSADLASFLARSEAAGGMGCQQAVMLDGGGSAQLWAADPSIAFAIPGLWTVPTGVAVVPRTTP